MLFLVAICLASSDEARGSSRVPFRQLTVGDGLSQNSVTAMLQDRAGFVWLGTRHGLNRFDGYSVITYLHDPGNPESLPGNGIQALCEDREGNLWIGTALGGLAVLDRRRGTFRSYRHDPSDPRSLSSNNVTSILEDRNGQLWIGTDQGLNVLDQGHGAFRRVKGLRAGDPAERVNVIRKGLIGYLWVGTDGGLFHLDTNRLLLRRQDSKTIGLPDERVRAILEENDGTLWVGTPAGLLRREGSSGGSEVFKHQPRENASLSNNVIRDLMGDSRGRVWIATADGLNRYEGPMGRFVRILGDPLDPASLPGGSVLCLLEDRGGLLWAGLDGGGASRLPIKGVQAQIHLKQTLAAAGFTRFSVQALLSDRLGRLFVGTPAGIEQFDPEKDGFHKVAGEAGEVLALFESRDGSLFAGTARNGLVRFDPDRGRILPASRESAGHPVTGIAEDKRGDLWLATLGGGLLRIRHQSHETTRFDAAPGAPGDLLFSIQADPVEDVLWLATRRRGLLRFFPQSGTFEVFRGISAEGTTLAGKPVQVLFFDRRGHLWAGTAGDGLFRKRSGSEHVDWFRTQDLLATNSIQGLAEDDGGNIWITSPGGLSVLDVKTGEMKPWSGLAGLFENEFSPGAALGTRDGTLFFGGSQGLISLRPEKVQLKPLPPHVALTALERSHQRTERSGAFLLSPEIELTPQDSAFSLTFAVLDFAAPERNRYAFKLESVDADWTSGRGQGRAFYGQLPPGRYRFLMKGASADGATILEPAVLMIVVKPPFFRTWWFYGLLAVCLVMPIRWLARKREERQREREDDLRRIIDEKTLQLENANRWLEKLSYLDPLTGIPNRRYFDEVIDEEWRRAQRAEGPLSLMFIDLDHFKSYNDMYGHQAGDACLKSAAGALRGVLKRAGDHVARYGGEEFVVILGGASLDDALHVAEMMRASVESKEIRHEGNPPAGVVTASFGVASAFPQPHSDVALLIKAADDALYLAKENGRNRVEAAKNPFREHELSGQTAS